MGKLDQREDGMRIVWMWFCRIFVVICILAELVVFIAEIIVVGAPPQPRGRIKSMMPLFCVIDGEFYWTPCKAHEIW